jgi:hypothetical protein
MSNNNNNDSSSNNNKPVRWSDLHSRSTMTGKGLLEARVPVLCGDPSSPPDSSAVNCSGLHATAAMYAVLLKGKWKSSFCDTTWPGLPT